MLISHLHHRLGGLEALLTWMLHCTIYLPILRSHYLSLTQQKALMWMIIYKVFSYPLKSDQQQNTKM